MAKRYKLLYSEASAKTGKGVQEFFNEIATKLPGSPIDSSRIIVPPLMTEQPIVLNQRQKANKDKKKCCWLFLSLIPLYLLNDNQYCMYDHVVIESKVFLIDFISWLFNPFTSSLYCSGLYCTFAYCKANLITESPCSL